MTKRYYLSPFMKVLIIHAVIFHVLKSKLEAQDFINLTKDDILGDLLYTTALSYFAELDMMNYVQSKTMGVESIRLPSESTFSLKLNAYSVFGIPQSVSAEGLAMDVARNLSAREAINGDNSKKVQFVMSAGMTSSALEHSVPEQLFSTPENPAQGVSAVKALQLANEQGIPIYTINQTNINTILLQLQIDGDVKADIQNAVNAGKEVTVSKTNINFNGWTGCGYIIIDPATGEGAYMINGGMNGAELIIEQIKELLLLLCGVASIYSFIAMGIAWAAGLPFLSLFLGALAAFLAGLVISQIWNPDFELRTIINTVIQTIIFCIVSGELYALVPFFGLWGILILAILLLVSLSLQYNVQIFDPRKKKYYTANNNWKLVYV